MDASPPRQRVFTRYQVFLIAALAFLQFTVILDFMVMAPLGAILMPVLHVTPGQFSHVVSAYAFSAGASGLLAAGFADKYDRKKLLIFFYVGFIMGTLFCGLAPTYGSLLVARVTTGIFGGVIGSVSMAIITDAFPLNIRGRVMGFVQMAFAVSQVVGIPLGLFLATQYDWHAPFLLIVGLGSAAGLVIFRFMRPVAEHLHLHHDTDPWRHLWKAFTNRRHRIPFLTMVILATGGFMMMPFSTTFLVNNVGIPEGKLPVIFMIVGACSMVTFPVVGRLSDRFGRLRTFVVGTIIAMVMVTIYSHLGITPLWIVIIINALSFVGIGSRIVSSQALMTAVPGMKDRGAFMSIVSSIQQVSGGVAAWIAGLIVFQTTETSPLEHYDTLGFVTCGTMLICVLLLYLVDRQVKQQQPAAEAHQMVV